MIELFDAARLLPRRDHTLWIAPLILVSGAVGMTLYADSVQKRAKVVDAQRATLEKQLAGVKALPVPTAAGLSELRAQVEKLEAEVATARNAATANGPVASQWLDRLALLAAADISLSKIDVERAGVTRIEGLARSPQAVSGFVQAFSTQDKQAPAQPRSIEVRHDKTTAQQVNFTMRATLAAATATAATTKVSTP